MSFFFSFTVDWTKNDIFKVVGGKQELFSHLYFVYCSYSGGVYVGGGWSLSIEKAVKLIKIHLTYAGLPFSFLCHGPVWARGPPLIYMYI